MGEIVSISPIGELHGGYYDYTAGGRVFGGASLGLTLVKERVEHLMASE